jgi:hypothetical protein
LRYRSHGRFFENKVFARVAECTHLSTFSV